MRSNNLLACIVLAVVMVSPSLSMAELVPEIQLGVRGIFSLDYADRSGSSETTLVNADDTAILLGFRQKLYSDYRGRLVIGLKFNDPDSPLGDVFYHHIFMGIESERSEFSIGRSRARTSLVEFPTLRDDDLLITSDILNPFASSTELESEDHFFAEMLTGSHLLADRLWITAQVSSFTEDPAEDFDINSAALLIEYMVPETQRWNRKVLQQIGVQFHAFLDVDNTFTGENEDIMGGTASLVLNLRPDPVNFWDLRTQVQYSEGLDEVKSVGNYRHLAQARALSATASLRYLHRRLEWPRTQFAATIGYRDMPDLTTDTRQLQFILNGLRRIGTGFDAGLQFSYRNYEGDLESLFGAGDETTIQAFLTYEFDARWNDQFDDRDSLLNLEHGYIP